MPRVQMCFTFEPRSFHPSSRGAWLQAHVMLPAWIHGILPTFPLEALRKIIPRLLSNRWWLNQMIVGIKILMQCSECQIITRSKLAVSSNRGDEQWIPGGFFTKAWPKVSDKNPAKTRARHLSGSIPRDAPFRVFLQFWENTFICIYSRLIVPALKPDTVGD